MNNKYDFDSDAIKTLEAPTLKNRAITGWRVYTGRLSIIKKRQTSWISATELSLPMLIVCVIASFILFGYWLIDEINFNRLLLGLSIFGGLSIVAVIVSKGSISYSMDINSSEVD